MIKNPRELGSRRPGVKRFPQWGGMDLESEPGSILPNEFRHLENTDFRGGFLQPRGGAVPIDTAQTGCVQHASDASDISPNKLYLVYQGCPGIGTTGVALGTYDTDYGLVAFRNLYYTFAEFGSIAEYDGYKYLGLDGFLKRLNLTIPRLGGTEPLLTTGTNQDTVIWTFPGKVIQSMGTAFGKLWLGVLDPVTPTASEIWVWDGLTMRLVLAGTACPTVMKPFRALLAIGYAAPANKITFMDADETFSDFAPGAGTVAAADMVSHEDKLYLVDNSENVWVSSGGVPTVERNIVGASIRGVESFAGMLWYLYKSSGGAAIVGRRAAAGVFTDAVKNLTTQEAGNIDVTRLRAYRGDLYAMTVRTSVLHRIWRSPGTNIPGTWTSVTSLPGTTGIPNIQQSAVF